jgi:hypothetical protein
MNSPRRHVFGPLYQLFLKYVHVTELMAVLQQKAKEEVAKQAAILESRQKREAEEAKIDAERQRQVDVIRKNAEAQDSTVKNEPDPPKKIPGRVAKSRFSRKPKSSTPASSGGAVTPAADCPPTEAPVKESTGMKRGARQTGLKGKKFSVGQLAAQFGVGKSADVTTQARRSVRKKNKSSRKNGYVADRRVSRHTCHLPCTTLTVCRVSACVLTHVGPACLQASTRGMLANVAESESVVASSEQPPPPPPVPDATPVEVPSSSVAELRAKLAQTMQ